MSAWDPRGDVRVPPRPPLPVRVEGDPTPPRRRSRFLRDPRLILVVYGVVLAAIAFWPVPVDRGAGPFLRLISQAIPVLTYPRIEFAANILLFVPLGLLLVMILTSLRWLVLPISFLASVTIECVQAVALHARTPSVHDVVANTAGACLGIIIAMTAEKLRHRKLSTNGYTG